MKTLTAFVALLVLAVVPARAEDDDKVTTLQGEINVLGIEQDVDKTLLREAMMVAGRARFMRMADRPDTDDAKKRAAVEAEVVEVFIREMERAVVQRAAELKKKSAELTSAAVQKITRLKPPDDKDRPGLIEKMEEAQVELQLLQMQSQMYQQKLSEALNALATAEFAADNDETQRGKAEAARKEFNDFRRKYADFRKKLRLEQETLAELQKRLGWGGVGGMGGGFQ